MPTRLRAMDGTKPDLTDMHIFGFKVYIHVYKELRRKMNDKTKEYRSIGIDNNSRIHRLLDTNTNSTIISRDVKTAISIKLDINDGNESPRNFSHAIPTHVEINEGNKDDIDKEAEDDIKDEASVLKAQTMSKTIDLSRYMSFTEECIAEKANSATIRNKRLKTPKIQMPPYTF
ncbi:uncharacterized protein LOC124432354 [Vespa crabro]|uniref:uncharacterized protein LOC124432354 n=1 Tax=Vespa crabro TaxID=7445 RepID=UPI001F02F974|nr:uncharacterized protein LOC124432354 [Vespa crabro]